jgi:hypothetical protein
LKLGDFVVAKEQWLEWGRELGRLSCFQKHALVFQDWLESGDENGTLKLDLMNLQGSFAVERRLLIVFDFVDLDGNSVVGFDDFGVGLLWRGFNPL